MPGRVRTGPQGQGAFTGRGMGVCNADSPRTGTGRGLGLGVRQGLARGAKFGLGLGLGYGCRRWFRANQSVEASDSLTQEKAYLERRLDAVNRQLSQSNQSNSVK